MHNKTSYLFSVVSNVIVDRVRAGRARHAGRHVPIYDLDLEAMQPNPEETFAARQRLARGRVADDVRAQEEHVVATECEVTGEVRRDVVEQWREQYDARVSGEVTVESSDEVVVPAVGCRHRPS